MVSGQGPQLLPAKVPGQHSIAGSWTSPSPEEGKYQHCNKLTGEVNSEICWWLLNHPWWMSNSVLYLRGPIEQKTLFDSRVERHGIYGWFDPFQVYQRGKWLSTLNMTKTYIHTAESATSLAYTFLLSNHRLGCLICLLRKYRHSCKISSSSCFITIDCSAFAGIIYYERSWIIKN